MTDITTFPESCIETLYSTTHGDWRMQDETNAWLVLYFYPRDNTPGCSNQAADFQKLLSDFTAINVKIMGVSRDTLSSHKRFAEKFSLEFPLLSDTEETLCNAFNVIRPKNMYGKMVKGIERSTFIFHNKTCVWASRKVKVDDHANIVLEWLQTHKN